MQIEKPAGVHIDIDEASDLVTVTMPKDGIPNEDRFVSACHRFCGENGYGIKFVVAQ